MSILGKLFGSDAAISKTIDTVANGLDKLHYGSQEKAEADAADRSEARSMLITWVTNTQGQNLARRILALSIAFVWLGNFIFAKLIAGAAIICASFTEMTQVKIDGLKELSTMLIDSSDQMNAAAMLILGFYFAAPHLDKFVAPITEKLKKGFSK